MKTRLVRRKEKLTLWPNCLPLPVSSQRAAMMSSLPFNLVISIRPSIRWFGSCVKGCYNMFMDFGYILVVLIAIFVSMTLHELMHGVIAYWLGDNTARLMGRLTLNPLKHIDPVMTIALPLVIIITNVTTGASMPVFGGAKPVPFNPANVKYGEWGVALLALGGPLVNFFLAFVTYIVAVLANFEGVWLQTANTIIMVNLGFFAFNILPIPPLDGSRVWYALAPDFVRNLFDAIERYGVFLVYAIVLVASPVLFSYMNAVISGCVRLFSLLV